MQITNTFAIRDHTAGLLAIGIGLIALPILVMSLCWIDLAHLGMSATETDQGLIAVLYFVVLFFEFFLMWVVFKARRNAILIATLLSVAFGPILAPIPYDFDVHGIVLLLVIAHIFFAWPVCLYWLIRLGVRMLTDRTQSL